MSAQDSLADLTVKQAAAGLRARTISSAELTKAVLARRAATEPRLHAWVEIREEEALAAAANADRDLRAGNDRGPLHGIPIAVKDIFDLQGYANRCGSRVREHAAPAIADAVSVARARAGGAVLLGKCVTQEFAAGVVSPPARNPWDPERVPGGSSGGSAAAVGVGSALAAFGSDTGGSVRIPAGVCGVVGLKPTFGTIDTAGVYPLAWSLDTVGPITKTVADAAAFFDVIRDPASHQPASAGLGKPLTGLRIGLERSHFLARVQPDVAEAIESSVRILRDLGAEVFDVVWSDAELAGASAFVINRVETVVVHEDGLRETPELYGPELRLRMEATALYPAMGYARALRARGVCRESMAALFRERRLDALITPTLPAVAAPADNLQVRYGPDDVEPVMLAYIRLTRPFNLTGQPAISVPCGFDRDGLPVGLQIVGRPYDEAMVCRIGDAFERAAGMSERRPALATSSNGMSR